METQRDGLLSRQEVKRSKTSLTLVVMLALTLVLAGFIIISGRADANRVARKVFHGLVPDDKITSARKLEGGSEPRLGCVVFHDSEHDGIRICAALGLVKTQDEQMREIALHYVRHGWPTEGKPTPGAQVFVGTLKRPPYFFVYAVIGHTNSFFIY